MYLLRVNMSNQTYQVTDMPEKYKNLAGRALTSNFIADEVPPLCHPLGPDNKLIFSAGFVTGTSAPTAARVSVGGKSPLTKGIKEANAGSSWGADLAVLNIGGLVIEGYPKGKEKFWGLNITWDGKPKVEFFDATEYTQKKLSEIFPPMYEKYGDRISVCSVGSAAEYGYCNSGIVFNDQAKRPSRYAGRGGLGAVMASKGVKFVLLDRQGAPGVKIANKPLFDEGRKKMIDALTTHAITKPKGGLNTYGTAILINIMNEAGGLPTNNFHSGRFEGAPHIAGEAIFETNKVRKGKEIYNHACSPGCIIQCSNTVYTEGGEEITSCLEYESVWSLGVNIGIQDLDDLAMLNHLCNEYGLDTIETGTTLGVAMEAGLMKFGDSKKAIELVHETGKGTPLGRILGAGTETAGRVLGVTQVPVVKGQSIPAYEPRAVKGIGITYATSTMGADHTAGYTIAPEILGVMGKQDPLSVEGKAALSRAFQATTAFIDSSGHCLFIAFAVLDIASGYQGMIDETNGILGTNWTAEDVVKYGSAILKVERKFNEAAGISKEADRLPDFMTRDPLPPHNQVFDVSEEILDAVYGEM